MSFVLNLGSAHLASLGNLNNMPIKSAVMEKSDFLNYTFER